MLSFPLTPVERFGFPPFKVFTTLFPDQGEQTIKKYMDGDTPISFAQYLNNLMSMGVYKYLDTEMILNYVRSLGLTVINKTYSELLHECIDSM